ncbi:hypothetical protein CCACVL1_00250, partial [Corchorus capsularis]
VMDSILGRKLKPCLTSFSFFIGRD